MIPSGGNCSPFDWNRARVLILTALLFNSIFEVKLVSGIRGNSLDVDV